jgi:hypothetical protein
MIRSPVFLLIPVGQNAMVIHHPYFSNKFFNFAYKQITKMAKGKMISEYCGKEKYSSKAQMAKHEKGEGKKVEKMEKKGMFPKMKKK